MHLSFTTTATMIISPTALLSLLFTSSLTVLFLLTLTLLVSLFYLLRLPPSPSIAHWSGLIMGHRGCRTNLNIPENSLQAFHYASEHGADAIELDCQLTADNQIVCMHDGTVDRVCEVGGEGWVAGMEVGDMTFEHVNGLTFRRTGKQEEETEPVEPEREKRKRWNAPVTSHTATEATPDSASAPHTAASFGDDWTPAKPYPPSLLTNERLDGPPSLEQVVRLAHAHHLNVMIEVKEYRNPALIMRQLLALFEANPWLYRHAYIATFNPYHIYLIRRLAPALPTVLLYCRDALQWYHEDRSKEMQLPSFINYRFTRWLVDRLLFYALPLLVAFLRPSGIGPHSPLMSVEQCERNRRLGVMMDVWVCNRRNELELWREEGAIVTTDWCFPKKEDRRGGQGWSGDGGETDEGRRRREWTRKKAVEEKRVRLEDERLERLQESQAKQQFDGLSKRQ